MASNPLVRLRHRGLSVPREWSVIDRIWGVQHAEGFLEAVVDINVQLLEFVLIHGRPRPPLIQPPVQPGPFARRGTDTPSRNARALHEVVRTQRLGIPERLHKFDPRPHLDVEETEQWEAAREERLRGRLAQMPAR